MKRRYSTVSTFAIVFASTLGVALAAAAAQPEASSANNDYAYRWPLKAEGQNAAWQFELTPEVYAALIDPGLGDFDVVEPEHRDVLGNPQAQLAGGLEDADGL